MDILVTGSWDNQQNSVSYIYKNNGDETFTKAYEFPGVRLGDIQWADLNNSGYLDIVMNGIFNDAVWLGRIYVFEPVQKVYTLVDTIVDMRASNISLCDFNNDNSVDFLLTGRYDFQDYRTILYENKWPVQNTLPQPPSEVDVAIGNSMIYVNWSEGIDNESTVTYNLRIGSSPGASDIYNSYGLSDGTLSVPTFGNMGTNTNVLLPWNHNGTFFVSVQSVDASLKGSAWSPETSFVGVPEVLNSGELVVFPNPALNTVNLKMFSTVPGRVSVEIVDMTGKIHLTSSFDATAGINHHLINVKNTIGQGTYIIRVTSTDLTNSLLISIE
jgi:hypothetical protein